MRHPEDVLIGVVCAVLLAVGVSLIVLGVSLSSNGDDKRNKRLNRTEIYAIQGVCKGEGVAFDVEDQDRLVYACADGKLRTINYGPTK